MVRRQGCAYYACPGNMYNPPKWVKTLARAHLCAQKKIRGVGLACQRSCCAGESCCRTHFRNGTQGVLHLTVSPAWPAKIVPLHMDLHPDGFFLSRGAWMAGECSLSLSLSVCVCVCVCVRACVRVCVCARACMCMGITTTTTTNY